MASTDPQVDPADAHATARGDVEMTTRQRLFELLHRELAAGAKLALARGVTPQRLAAHLDERTALLRTQLGRVPKSSTSASDAPTADPEVSHRTVRHSLE